MRIRKKTYFSILFLAICISFAGFAGYFYWKNVLQKKESALNMKYALKQGSLRFAANCRTKIPYYLYGSMFVCYFEGLDAPLDSRSAIYQSEDKRVKGPVKDGVLIDNNWGFGEISKTEKKDFVSGVWRGQILFSEGRYVFSAFSDDGIEVIMDGKTIISKWFDTDGTEIVSEPIALDYDFHEVIVRWYEKKGGAQLRLTTKLIPK